MNLVVDTSVWSLVLRRPRVDDSNIHVQAFRQYLESNHRLFLTGNILQELLDGLRSPKQFDRLVQLLEPFPLLELDHSTYIAAAKLRTLCLAKGVQASPVDFLIAAACIQQGYPLLTADQDFSRIARCLVPAFDGVFFSHQWRDALWGKYFTGAPARQRRCVERSNRVKRA